MTKINFAWIARIGADPADSSEIKLQKSLLAICSFPFMIAGLIWGLMYIAFGELRAGLIPLSYSLISLISFIFFAFTGQFKVFRFSQLLLILVLPFALMMTLGGFVNGSAVILWGVISPLGALLFDKPAHSLRWFLAFLFLVILSGILQPYLNTVSNLSTEVMTLFFVINFIGVAALIFILVFHFVGKKNLYQSRSEALLLNILPKEIVEILRDDQITVAEHFENTSILFADVVNFTPLSTSLTPTELVNLLNEVFSKFDTMVEKYGLEKIKTIGDCYMVASGVPVPRPDHAKVLIKMAIEMKNFVANNEFLGYKLNFRFGINSGPVVAGVIGLKKFSYDLWGDAVNTASRMESYGKKDCIQISQETYELIKDEFNCQSNGSINVKGKGEMKVWFVTG